MYRCIVLIGCVLFSLCCNANIPKTNNHGFVFEVRQTSCVVEMPGDTLQPDTVHSESWSIPIDTIPQQQTDTVQSVPDNTVEPSPMQMSKQELLEKWEKQNNDTGEYAKWSLIMAVLSLGVYLWGSALFMLFSLAGIVIGVIGLKKNPGNKKKLLFGIYINVFMLLLFIAAVVVLLLLMSVI